jgi:hypothetical protein
VRRVSIILPTDGATDADEYPEWAMTAQFYSSLHYVHSSLADEGNFPRMSATHANTQLRLV